MPIILSSSASDPTASHMSISSMLMQHHLPMHVLLHATYREAAEECTEFAIRFCGLKSRIMTEETTEAVSRGAFTACRCLAQQGWAPGWW